MEKFGSFQGEVGGAVQFGERAGEAQRVGGLYGESVGEVEGLHYGGDFMVAVVALAEDFESEVQLGVGIYGYHLDLSTKDTKRHEVALVSSDVS